jgi:hypothetical protein
MKEDERDKALGSEAARHAAEMAAERGRYEALYAEKARMVGWAAVAGLLALAAFAGLGSDRWWTAAEPWASTAQRLSCCS